LPRIRYLKPEFFTDEDLADFPFETRLTFAGLWCHADKAGRLEDRPRFLGKMIFPYDDIDMEKQLTMLANRKANGKPFIIRYELDNTKLIQIVEWNKHQKPHHTEKESNFQPPKEESFSPPAPPFYKEENKIMGMGTEKQLNASTELNNVQKPVKQRLKNTALYNCPFFQEFWKCYPRREGKGKAWEEWSRISPAPDGNFSILVQNAIDRQKKTVQWNKDGGQFIPLPATWLHQRRWEDEGLQNPINGIFSDKTARTLANFESWEKSRERQE